MHKDTDFSDILQMLSKFERAEKYFLTLTVAVSGLAALYIFLSYTKMPVFPDTGYYISIAKEVAEGATPTVDVQTSYTPAVYYVYSLWIKALGSNFSTILLLVYIVNALNALLIYLIISSFLEQRAVKLLICFSYFYTVMISEGYSVELEPFQILFILLAYLVYLKNLNLYLKHAVIGLFVGVSFMFKQYSILLLFGFFIAFWLDYRRKEVASDILKRTVTTFLFFFIPFFAFVLLTRANMYDSIYSFGFFRRSALSYMAQGQSDIYPRMKNGFFYALKLNWLFIPFFLHLYYVIFNRTSSKSGKGLFPLFIASSLPLVVRQYGHYFQGVAPWSYIFIGILSAEAIKMFDIKKNNIYLLSSIAVCFFVILPVYVTFHPFYNNAIFMLFLILTLLYLASILLTLCWGIYRSGYMTDLNMVVFVLTAFIFFESLFFSFNIPFSDFAKEKISQIKEAAEINKIFAQGSNVYVIDYPQLYTTCNFRNPLHDYDLIFLETYNVSHFLRTIPWDKIDNIILRKNSQIISPEMLKMLNYKNISAPPGLQVSLYVRERNMNPSPGKNY